MFSNTVKYAIKACLYLAVHSSPDKKLMVKDIAGPINVPQAYMAKILQDLSKKDLISSTRGSKGGFYLNDENRNINVHDIIIAVDKEEKLRSCLLSLNNCDMDNPCSLHHLAYNKRGEIIQNLKSTSLDDLANDIRDGKSFLPL